MSDGFVPDFGVPAYEWDLEPEEFRAMIYGHENSQVIRWWRAVVDPSFNTVSGLQDAANNRLKWLHEEQQNIARYRAVISDGRLMKRYLPQGEFVSGDLTIMTMPDELPLGDHDWVVPMGRQWAKPGTPANARTVQSKEPLVRGSVSIAGVGTLTASGDSVVGTGTAFLSFLRAGDIVTAARQSLRVVSVADDTHLTVESAPFPAWKGNTFVKSVETLTYYPVAQIEEIRDSGRVYLPGAHYTLGADERTVQWLSATNSPVSGAGLSVVYRTYPKYELLGDLGLYNHAVRGVALPQTVTMRLIRPDTLQE